MTNKNKSTCIEKQVKFVEGKFDLNRRLSYLLQNEASFNRVLVFLGLELRFCQEIKTKNLSNALETLTNRP